MEPAGVEPASANRSPSASTCVVRRSCFSLRQRPADSLLWSQPRFVSLPDRRAESGSQPDSFDAFSQTSGRVQKKTGA
jgi:hypothetical protein